MYISTQKAPEKHIGTINASTHVHQAYNHYQPNLSQKEKIVRINEDKDNNRRNVDNTPSWMAGHSHPTFHVDKPRKLPVFVVNATCYNTNLDNMNRLVHVAIDNRLPAIATRFGTSNDNEINFHISVDSCTGLNIGNLRVHQ